MVDDELFKTTVTHAMELWFEPEIRRRQQIGAAPKPYLLVAAQVIVFADDRPNQVRLNEEVQAIASMKLTDGIVKAEGDVISMDELEGISSIHLPDTEDSNCGHFTLVLIGNRWHGAIDFRYNKGHARQLLDAAEEFFLTASEAILTCRRRAAIDNLFSAAELAAKAYVITTPAQGDRQPKRHGHIHSRFNISARDGNVEPEHRSTFNRLTECRRRGRYLDGALDETLEEISKWKVHVEELIETVRARVGAGPARAMETAGKDAV